MQSQFAIIDMQEARHAVVESNPRFKSALRVTWEESGETESIVFDKDRYLAVPYLSADFWQLATPVANGRFMKEHPLEFYVEVLETLSKGTGKVITLDALAKKVKDLRGLPKVTLGRPNLQTHEKLKRLFRLDERGAEFTYRPDHGLESFRPLTIVVEPRGAARPATSPLDAAKQYFAPASHLVASKDFDGLAFDVDATAILIRYISENTQKWPISEAYEKSSELGDASCWSQLVLLITFGARAEIDTHIKTWTSVQVNADYFAELVNRSLYSNLHSISQRTNFANLAFKCMACHGNAFINKLSETGFSDFLASFADLAQISENEDCANLVLAFVKRTEKESETGFVSGLQKTAVRMLNSPNPTKVNVATQFLNAVSKQRRLDLSARASAKRGPNGGTLAALRLDMDPKTWLSGLTFENLAAFKPNDEFVVLLQTDHFKQQVVEQISIPFASEPWDSGKFQAFFSAKKWLQEIIYKNVASERLADGVMQGRGFDEITSAIFGELVSTRELKKLEQDKIHADHTIIELHKALKTVRGEVLELSAHNARLEKDLASLVTSNQAKFKAAVEFKAGHWFRALSDLLDVVANKFEVLAPNQVATLSLQILSQAGFQPIGRVGEVLDFDELSHEFAEKTEDFQGIVRIISSGVRFTDADGKTQVVRRAIVVAY